MLEDLECDGEIKCNSNGNGTGQWTNTQKLTTMVTFRIVGCRHVFSLFINIIRKRKQAEL
jgi:hypothetical protein